MGRKELSAEDADRRRSTPMRYTDRSRLSKTFDHESHESHESEFSRSIAGYAVPTADDRVRLVFKQILRRCSLFGFLIRVIRCVR